MASLLHLMLEGLNGVGVGLTNNVTPDCESLLFGFPDDNEGVDSEANLATSSLFLGTFLGVINEFSKVLYLSGVVNEGSEPHREG